MKILYFCNVHKNVPTEMGVLKKVLAQCSVMRNAGHFVYIACPCDNSKFVITDNDGIEAEVFCTNTISRYKRDSYIFAKIQRFIKENGINVIYSRYSNFSVEAHLFYKKLKKIGVFTLLEIPTYPMSQRWTSIKQSIRSGNFRTALIQTYNSTIGTAGVLFFKHSILRIVNNNGFNKIWGIPVIPITNGIDVNSIPSRKHCYSKKKKILVTSVANVAKWHGYDRFISGLHVYYKSSPSIEVYFELAGPGLEVELLKKQVKCLGVEKYVQFLGPISGSDLDKLYDRSDIGISILGIHRNNMDTIDCLKSREFCARRLPFITQSAEKHFNNKEFAMMVESDESPIDINEVVDFYDEIVERPNILDCMYDFAKTQCDWSVAFSNVVAFINSIDNDRKNS